MKFSLYFILSVCVSILTHAQNPITLTNAHMPVANDTLRYTTVNLNSIGNYTQTGINFTWNFKNVNKSGEGLREFKSALNTPYGFFFLAPGEFGEKIADTLVSGTGTISITKFYNYYRKSTLPVNGFLADGVGLSINNIPVPCYYTDKDELYLFPLTYPKYDSTTFKFTTPTTSLLPISFSKAGYRITQVDGWGTVQTPFGTENVIRLVSTQYSKDTIRVNLPIPNLPPIKLGVQNNQRSYQWLSLNGKIPYFEVSGIVNGTQFTPNQARYRGYNIADVPVDVTGIITSTTNAIPSCYFSSDVSEIKFKNQDQIGTFLLIDATGKIILEKNSSYFKHQSSISVDEIKKNSVYYGLIITDQSIYTTQILISNHE